MTPRLWTVLGVGAIITVLFFALLTTRATLVKTKAALALAEGKLGVSNASALSCADELNRATADQVALANADSSRIRASRQIVELANVAAEARQAAIDRLRLRRPTFH